MKKDDKRHLITSTNPKSPIAEAFRTLRTNIHFSALDRPFKTIMITSAGPGEGKSTTLANLAVAMAQAGAKVLVIDCDLRKPVQHRVFEVSGLKGITNILVEQADIDITIQSAAVERLSVLPCGPIPPNPSELLGSNRMQDLLEHLKNKFDIILIDSPPVVAVTDAAILSAQVDGVILVLRAGVARIDMVKQTKEQIEKANGKIIGTVLYGTKVSEEDYHYYYYYGEKKGKRKNA
ncbi:CpsD/CapB family tyrosine-protein kinase [Phosphitispora sp. TUW77]|uniref:CpsD/CapB family tyrosine-protein kinase n=1 Tax=Phosphitispora sp. TUW77 TaxID=3152361 RepID=UPI003AB2EED1